MKTICFENDTIERYVLGINDRNIPYLEALLNTTLYTKGNCLICDDSIEIFNEFFTSLIRTASIRGCELSESEIFMEYQMIMQDIVVKAPFTPLDDTIVVNSKSIYPKSKTQSRFIQSLYENQINFAVGPAGTGKTFLSICYALMQLLSGKKQKLILTRPVVEAGESLGFLPGDLAQKLNPYLKPLYDAMEYVLSPKEIKKLEENQMIEISPLAYMRGRSINKAIIILDEAQNSTKSQMKMFLTRLGEDSRAIITGDISQIDLPSKSHSGLVHAIEILHDIPSLNITYFSKDDIIRSRIVKAIINCYDNS